MVANSSVKNKALRDFDCKESFCKRLMSRYYRGNNIIALLFVFGLAIATAIALKNEIREFNSILEIPKYSENEDPVYYACKSQSRVLWRDSIIGAFFSTLTIFFFLYVLKYPVNAVLFIIMMGVIFIILYLMSNFRNFHWYKEICIAAQS